MTPKGYLSFAIMIAFAILLAAVAVQTHRADRFKALDTAHRACVAAIKPGARADLDPSKLCDPAIASRHAAAVRAEACDAAFAARPENTYGAAASCSASVKRVQVERDVAQADGRRLTADLARERDGQGAAIDRAMAAATTNAERKARAVAAVQAAPRDSDGLVVCDAQCVRNRWGVAAVDKRP